MELDGEPEDTHGYQPSGFLNPLTLPEAKGYPSPRVPNLYGMVTHMGIIYPPVFTPDNNQSMCTSLTKDLLLMVRTNTNKFVLDSGVDTSKIQ